MNQEEERERTIELWRKSSLPMPTPDEVQAFLEEISLLKNLIVLQVAEIQNKKQQGIESGFQIVEIEKGELN